MPAWFPLVVVIWLRNGFPLIFFCLGRKNHSVSVNWCAKKRGKKGGGVCVRVCVHVHAPKKFLESSR